MNAPLQQPVHVRISSTPAHLPVVRAAIEKMCEQLGFDAETAGNVVLSVDEALTNVIRHAYEDDPSQPIEIALAPFDSPNVRGLRIQLRDYGKQVDPAKIKSRDLADVRPGGLGVHIMNECMDSVEFTAAEGGGTLLTLIKNLPSEQEAAK